MANETEEVEQGKKLGTYLGLLAASMAVSAVAKGALLVAKSVSATNIHKSDVTGDKTMSPTNDETNLQESKAGASKTDAALSQDEVSAQNGKVEATETNAKASTAEATAAESGAQALKTKAGACDIQTKGMKMN